MSAATAIARNSTHPARNPTVRPMIAAAMTSHPAALTVSAVTRQAVLAMRFVRRHSNTPRTIATVAELPRTMRVVLPRVDVDETVRESLDSVSRSEEHTSELQSRGHRVFGLLLAKKKEISDLRVSSS